MDKMRPEPRRQFARDRAKNHGRPRHALPLKGDFITIAPNRSGYYEQVDAWTHFGGKTLDEACRIFCESPEVFQEDFMFMGAVAFRFYLPVLDRYLRGLDPATLFDTWPSMGMFAMTIGHHIGEPKAVAPHRDLLEALCAYVCEHLLAPGEASKYREQTHQSWAALREQIATLPPTRKKGRKP